MDGARLLYSRAIVQHARDARNRRVIADATHRAPADNPLCGDQLDVYLKVEGGVIRDLAYLGCTCALATASASMMSQALLGVDRERARGMLDSFSRLIRPQAQVPEDLPGEFRIFEDVRALPARMQCAELAWQALRSALFKEVSS